MSLNKTQIEWVRNPDGTPGYSWNPISGCLKGCPFCYARELAETRLRHIYMSDAASEKFITLFKHGTLNMPEPFYPRFWPDRLTDPDLGRLVLPVPDNVAHKYVSSKLKPKGIFTVNMGDMFGPWVPDEWIQAVMDTIRACPQHRFYLLTKFPERLKKWSQFPRACWVGATATDAATFYDAAAGLYDVSASLRYISFEPLQGPINGGECGLSPRLGLLQDACIRWAIIGARTKPLVLPDKAWVDEIIEAADKAGIPVFLKDSLKTLYPEGLRQEMPG